jgi:hypothetical protein
MSSMPTLTECLAAELTPRLEALWESSPEFRGLAEGFKRLFQQEACRELINSKNIQAVALTLGNQGAVLNAANSA